MSMSATKRCPLCGAHCFEDMDTCYCCMHRFAQEEVQIMEQGLQEDVAWFAEQDLCFGDTTSTEGFEPDEEYGVSEIDELARGETLPMHKEAAGQSEEIRDSSSGLAGTPPCFAFGPSIESLSNIGECVRIDIPLRALSAMIAAASRRYPTESVFDLPPAA